MARRYSVSTDANHKEIVEYLQKHGIWAEDCAAYGDGFLDLITHSAEYGFLELKIEGSGAKFKRKQLSFMSRCPKACGFAQSDWEALRFARDPERYGLSQKEKDRLAVFLMRYPKHKEFSVNTIVRVLAGEHVEIKSNKKTK